MKLKRGNVDLKGWNLGVSEDQSELLEQLGRNAAESAIKCALSDDFTHAVMPAIYGDTDGFGGSKCDDPLSIYFVIALSNDDDDAPVMQASLSEILDEDIAEMERDGSYMDGLIRIRDAMRELADKIDKSAKAFQANKE